MLFFKRPARGAARPATVVTWAALVAFTVSGFPTVAAAGAPASGAKGTTPQLLPSEPHQPLPAEFAAGRSNAAPESKTKTPSAPQAPEMIPSVPAENFKPTRPVQGFVEGRSIEDASKRTRTSETFSNPDGTFSTRIASKPLHYWTGTSWEKIDNTIVPDKARPGSARNKANSFEARFSPLADGISIVTADGTLGMRPLGAESLPQPEIAPDGKAVLYRNVWGDGVDLRYRVEADHVKAEIILQRRPSSSTFRFAVDGATVAARPDGGLDLRGRLAGKWWILPPVVLDRNGAEVGEAQPQLLPEDGGRTIAAALDPGWLAGLRDSDFPVIFDPSPADMGGDSQAYSDTGLTCDPCPIRVGRDDSNAAGRGAGVWRSVVYFDYAFNNWFLSGSTIMQVGTKLEVKNVQSSPASGSQWLDAWRANSYSFWGGQQRARGRGFR